MSPDEVEGPLPTSKGLGRREWAYAARRATHGFWKHRGLDSAAALTFFSTLALFPASLVLVSAFALGESRDRATDRIVDILGQFLTPSSVEALRDPVHELLNIPNPGIALGIGIILSIWSVSSYATSFGRAMNTTYEVQEGRKFLKFRVLMMLLTLVLMVGFVCIAAILIGTPTIAGAIANSFGWPELWVEVWNVAKWPVLLVIEITMVGIVYYFSPNVKHLRLRWVSWGAVFAIVVWAIATGGFAVYVVTFDTYNHVYGWLGGAIVVLVWLYITNLVLVVGAEVDAEIVRLRQLTAGIEAEHSIKLPVRDTARNLVLAKQEADAERDGRAIRLAAVERRRLRDEQ